MSPHRIQFEHDGNFFGAEEREDADSPGPGEPQVRWTVHMNGAAVLEFHGAFPYRDDDVRKRVVGWYEIQKPRR